MVNHMNEQHDIRAICRAYFELAKERYSATITCKLLVFVVGILSLFKIFYEYSRLITFFLILLSEWLNYLSEKNKGIAEALLRKLDAQNSFGWLISNAEVSDIIINCSKNLEKFIFEDTYFASQEEIGAKRALENIQESAWWSKHLAKRMGDYYLVGNLIFFVIWIGVLFVGIKATDNISNLSILLNIVVLALMLVFSLSLLRSMTSYYKFSNAAEKIEKNAGQLLLGQDIHDSDAMKIMFEYHLIRANAPLLPSWLWKSMRDDLNNIWRQYRSSSV